MKKAVYFLVIFFVETGFSYSSSNEISKDIANGAAIYKDRCILCHGSKGMGEGILPLRIDNYPNTNFYQSVKSADLEDTISRVRHGGIDTGYPIYSPPWKDELSEESIENVSHFVMMLINDPNKAQRTLSKVKVDTNHRRGSQIYITRCGICHGQNGLGDGQLRAALSGSPPANLTTSSLSVEEMTQIVTYGGSGVSRSSSMPPWGEELLPEQIESVVEHVLTFRAANRKMLK